MDSDEVEATLAKLEARKEHLNLKYNQKERAPSAPRNQQALVEENLFQKWVKTQSLELAEDSLVLQVQQNENMFKNYGEKRLRDQRNIQKQNQSLLKFKENSEAQSVMSDLLPYKFLKQVQNESVIYLSQNLLLIGTQTGQLFVFCIKTEKLLGINKSEANDNPVTAIDVHALRPEYCCVGYAKGHIALVNLQNPSKTMKVIKDHHVAPVVQLKFCDWAKEKPHLNQGPDHKCKECQNVGSWMLISIDQTGRVVQTLITNLAFGAMFASQTVFVDPNTIEGDDSIYQTVKPRMSSKQFAQEFALDNETVVAIGNSDHVVVLVTPEKSRQQKIIIDKPKRYASQNIDNVMPVMSQYPLIAWGFGRTPRYNWQTFPLLAIAWGPIIQLVVMKKLDALNPIENFELDGHYIIASERAKNKGQQSPMDITLTSLDFIDESLLVATTSSQEIRVMLTSKFKEREFVPPAHLEEIDFSQLTDARIKMGVNGAPLTQEEAEIEMERKQALPAKLLINNQSVPLECQPCFSVYHDTLVLLTEQGIYQTHHLNWLESLGDTDNQVTLASSWIEIFGKALEIYTGKVQGLRIHNKEQSDSMRDQLKQLIDKRVGQIIAQWKVRADMNIKAGKMSPNQVHEDLNNKFQTLIRTVIEFCVEIREPIFLFDTLLKKFSEENKSMLFAEELKPYILSGCFAECSIEEDILSEQILQHHQKTFSENYIKTTTGQRGESVPQAVSPAENFEKILVNFRFECCSKEYLLMLIDFCIQYKLTSAMIYLCLASYGEQGPIQAITQLKDFYLDTLTNELCGEQLIHKDDLTALHQMPANLYDRILLERSSCYLGYKLLSTAQLFLTGKKFPRGIFSTEQWDSLCNDLMDLFTQDTNIHHLLKIDAEAYFDIIRIVFSPNSQQYQFIEKAESMSHELIVTRIASYFTQIVKPEDSAHLPYLFFVASVVKSYQAEQENTKARICLQTSIDLVQQGNKAVEYFDTVIRKGSSLKGAVETQTLVESMILMLLEMSLPVLDQESKQILWQHMEKTPFLFVKLRVLEIQNNYLQALQLFLRSQIYSGQAIQGPLRHSGFEDPFDWISGRYEQLEQLAFEQKIQSHQIQVEHFQQEVMNNSLYLVQQNTVKTVKMCDVVFRNAHLEFIDQLKEQKQLQLAYIQILLDLKHQYIKETLTATGQAQATIKYAKQKSIGQQKQQLNKILALHIRLICELNPSEVTSTIENVIRESFYPMEECLRICRDHDQTEAAALLNKKIGNYQQAIALYLDILYSDLNKEKLKKELYYLNKETNRHSELVRDKIFVQNQQKFKMRAEDQTKKEIVKQKVAVEINYQATMNNVYTAWVERYGQQIDMIDKSLEKIMNICKAHPEQSLQTPMGSVFLWQQIMIFLFDVLTHPSLRFKRYCKRHLKLKIVTFVRCILNFVSFADIMKQVSLTSGARDLKFKAVKPLMHDVFADKTQEHQMCRDAMTTLRRDLMDFIENVAIQSRGYTFTEKALKCFLCEEDVRGKGIYKDSWFQGQPDFSDQALPGAVLFDCVSSHEKETEENHAAHRKCIIRFLNESMEPKKANGQFELRCLICFPRNLYLPPLQESKAMKKKRGDSSDSDDYPTQSYGTMARSRKLGGKGKNQFDYEKRMKKFEEQIFLAERLTKQDFQLSLQEV